MERKAFNRKRCILKYPFVTGNRSESKRLPRVLRSLKDKDRAMVTSRLEYARRHTKEEESPDERVILAIGHTESKPDEGVQPRRPVPLERTNPVLSGVYRVFTAHESDYFVDKLLPISVKSR